VAQQFVSGVAQFSSGHSGPHPSAWNGQLVFGEAKFARWPDPAQHLAEHVHRIFFERIRGLLCYLRSALEDGASMAEKLVLVGVIPEIVVIGPEEQVVWLSDTGNLKIQFDPNRCPFQSNIFQAPPGRQLQSGPPRPGTNPGSFKYRLWLNDQPVGNGEVILREK
jgi:hypothetical protein